MTEAKCKKGWETKHLYMIENWGWNKFNEVCNKVLYTFLLRRLIRCIWMSFASCSTGWNNFWRIIFFYAPAFHSKLNVAMQFDSFLFFIKIWMLPQKYFHTIVCSPIHLMRLMKSYARGQVALWLDTFLSKVDDIPPLFGKELNSYSFFFRPVGWWSLKLLRY